MYAKYGDSAATERTTDAQLSQLLFDGTNTERKRKMKSKKRGKWNEKIVNRKLIINSLEQRYLLRSLSHSIHSSRSRQRFNECPTGTTNSSLFRTLFVRYRSLRFAVIRRVASAKMILVEFPYFRLKVCFVALANCELFKINNVIGCRCVGFLCSVVVPNFETDFNQREKGEWLLERPNFDSIFGFNFLFSDKFFIVVGLIPQLMCVSRDSIVLCKTSVSDHSLTVLRNIQKLYFWTFLSGIEYDWLRKTRFRRREFDRKKIY